MKNQQGLAGIDLNNLTEAQRKMCVKLLALNNVEFKENQDSYVATLRLSANDIKNYVHLNKEVKNTKKQRKSIGSSSASLTTITTQNKKPKIDKQSAKSKEKYLQKTPVKQQKVAGNTNIQAQLQSKPQPGSKKPLFKSVKLAPIPRLQQLHPSIQIYIYPKRVPLQIIQQQIELAYELYWQRGNSENDERLVKIYYHLVCENKIGNNKARVDQNLVNSLETINHFQYKELGVNIFYLFLSEKYPLELLSYFMVIRALIQDLVGQKIFYSKNKAFVPYTGNVNSNFGNNKAKLKWNPHLQELHEGLCEDFLKIVLNHPQSDKQKSDIFNSNTFSNKNKKNSVQSVFQRLTTKMYYCETKKGNFIKYYDLIDFMLKLFQSQCSEDHSVTNLQLSYSQNSTLNDIIIESSRLCPRGQPQTKYQIEMVEVVPETEKEDEYTLVEEPEIMNNHSVFYQAALAKADEICRRMHISGDMKDQILEKVSECVESITRMDKVKWIEGMKIEGSEQQINFIESIQIQYRKMCSEDQKLTMVNSLAKKMLMGPGFLKLFSSKIKF